MITKFPTISHFYSFYPKLRINRPIRGLNRILSVFWGRKQGLSLKMEEIGRNGQKFLIYLLRFGREVGKGEELGKRLNYRLMRFERLKIEINWVEMNF